MKRKLISIIILIAILFLAICAGLSACGTGGVSAADVTATYGAQQLHIQLTAQAGQK